jgi:hypothetical protein
MLLTIVAVVIAASVAVSATAATVPKLYDNCTNFNKKYAHGVGRVGARDKTKTKHPVTTFVRSNAIYKTAMKWNDDLDRDDDGIACETA